MAMNGYVDGELDMMCEGLFDNIEDLLDFSTDDEILVEAAAAAAAAGSGCQQIAPPPPAAAAVFPSTIGEGSRLTATSEENKVCDDINIGEDWITNFLDDSNFDIDFPATPTANIAAAAGPKDEPLFQSFSPVSVLEEPNNLMSSSISEKGGGSSSSSSSSSTSTSINNEIADMVSLVPVGPTMMLVPARPRSKRPRRAAPAHVTIPILPPASEGPTAVPTPLPECESFGNSPCPGPPMKKKKKNNLGLWAAAGDAGSDDVMAVRKCQHCGIQKTPQWRAGPMGPKTLCNACGVRYKSGRLFPEYRPAASPTFVPSLHSSSHKKVVEMRIKACQQKAVDGTPSPEYPAAKNCDLLAYIRREGVRS